MRIAVAAATSTVVLLLFGVVTLETPASEAIGRITLQVFPAGVGAMLARSQMRGAGAKKSQGGQPRSYGRELLLMVIGALFLGLGVAATEEVMLLAYKMGPWREIALALLSPEAGLGDEVVVDVRGREVAAEVVKPPFVQVQTRQG